MTKIIQLDLVLLCEDRPQTLLAVSCLSRSLLIERYNDNEFSLLACCWLGLWRLDDTGNYIALKMIIRLRNTTVA